MRTLRKIALSALFGVCLGYAFFPSSAQTPEENACAEVLCPFPPPAQRPLASLSCTPETELQADLLHAIISLRTYMLRLEAVAEPGGQDEQRCTLLEQRVIVGKKDWRTPQLETTILYALTYPSWYPTPKIIEELKEKEPQQYAALSFDEKTQRHYLPSGPQNPLGKTKFVLDTPHLIFLHGTPYKSLFEKKKRDFSHGCIRTEDEIALLKTLSRVAGSDCNEACIDATLAAGKSRKITFQKPIYLKITQ